LVSGFRVTRPSSSQGIYESRPSLRSQLSQHQHEPFVLGRRQFNLAIGSHRFLTAAAFVIVYYGLREGWHALREAMA
jgi:hypothetical protein